MHSRLFWSIFAVGLLVMLAGLGGLDMAIARSLGPEADVLGPFVDVLDGVTLKQFSGFILGAIIIVASLIGTRVASLRQRAWLTFYIGIVQFSATTVCDLSKPLFGRLRPYEMLAEGGADRWFVGANSFPSGHAGFYAGVVFPIVALWPKTSWPLLGLPLLVAIQRVTSLDHYLSDVSASIAAVALLTMAFRRVAKRSNLPAAAASAQLT